MLLARSKKVIVAAVAGGLGWMTFAGAGAADASVITISSNNSTAKFETASGQTNPVGQFSWTIDGYDVLARQWFWYRIGSTGPEQSIDALDASPDIAQPDAGSLVLDYAGSLLRTQVVYQLTGGQTDSAQSVLNETIVLTNTGSTTMHLHFFQYVDINLFDPSAGPDTLIIANGNTAVQSNPTSSVSETVTTPSPTYYMAGLTPAVLNLLTDGAPTTLGIVPGPVVGDVSWAFQWDLTLAPNHLAIISKVKSVDLRSPSGNVPEPATIALLAAGAMLVLTGRRVTGKDYRPNEERASGDLIG